MAKIYDLSQRRGPDGDEFFWKAQEILHDAAVALHKLKPEIELVGTVSMPARYGDKEASSYQLGFCICDDGEDREIENVSDIVLNIATLLGETEQECESIILRIMSRACEKMDSFMEE